MNIKNETNIKFKREKEEYKYQKEYNISNVDCASCALKIEDGLNAHPDLKARYRFEQDKLIIKSNNKINDQEIDKIVRDKEKQAKISLDEIEEENNSIIPLLIVFALFLITKFILPFENLKIAIYIVLYIYIGRNVLSAAFNNIRKGDIFDENFLMSLATLTALVIGYYDEAVAVMMFYELGEFFQDKAVSKSKKSIKAIMDLSIPYTNLLENGKIVSVLSKNVQLGSTIVVRKGEKVPIDGIVISGNSQFDTSSITGESIFTEVKENSKVTSGFLNMGSEVRIKTTSSFSNSTTNKMKELIEEANDKKAPTEQFITKFSKIYTPSVVFAAILLAIIGSLITGEWQVWLTRALVFLVVSCPCALVLSVPLTYFASIGKASSMGILVKGSEYLDKLNDIKIINFDKTGTITDGKLQIINYQADDFQLKLASSMEILSNHPISNAFKEVFKKAIFTELQVEEITGRGLKTHYQNQDYYLGSNKLATDLNLILEDNSSQNLIIYLMTKHEVIATFELGDKIKNEAATTLELLSNNYQLNVLSGDSQLRANILKESLTLDNVYGNLDPLEKADIVKKQPEAKLFIGDGINDGVVMKQADLAISMGGIGSDVAIEASDIVFMDDDLAKLDTLFKLAKKNKRILSQNISFILIVKAITLILGAMGYANMYAAVFADVGTALIAVLNATRISKV